MIPLRLLSILLSPFDGSGFDEKVFMNYNPGNVISFGRSISTEIMIQNRADSTDLNSPIGQ